ncbi:hypothetical protein RN001_004519 [Aquatica leii]|uniref:MADF domain-containing protein n=1 Tax=Aquatica leii TaxID=1421715 RepID=A0AAN7P5F8_9COLE|nr:hypothetical protein RN001_004519 [Aquatica leii]
MSWTRPQITALIDLYRDRDVLYKIKSSLYHNKSARVQALNQIVGGLQEIRPGTTINDVKIKINSLRTQFNKEIGKLRSQPSGSGATLVKISMWCFEDLLFLQDQSIVRESFTNLPQQQGCSSWSERVEMEDASSPTQNPDETITETYSSSTTDGDLEVAPASTSRKRKSSNNPNKEVTMRVTLCILALALVVTASSFESTECGENEVYGTCHSHCPPACDSPKSVACIASCRIGCGCKPGYLLNSNGKCVTQREC